MNNIFSNISYFDIFLTTSCNLNCTYCYQQKKLKQNISFDILKKLSNILDLFDYIRLFGGEPTLAEKQIQFIEEKYSCIQKLIITNGLFSKNFKNLVLNNKNKWHIRISFDGIFNDITRSKTKEVIKNLEWCKKNNIDFSIFSVFPFKYEKYLCYFFKSLYQIYEFLGLYGNIKFLFDVRYNIRGYNYLEISSEFLRLYTWYKNRKNKYITIDFFEDLTNPKICGAGMNFFSMNYDGKIYKCNIAYSGSKKYTDHYVSNIFFDKDILRNDIIRSRNIHKTYIEQNYKNIPDWSKYFMCCPMNSYKYSFKNNYIEKFYDFNSAYNYNIQKIYRIIERLKNENKSN